jgi:hypothetical protein
VRLSPELATVAAVAGERGVELFHLVRDVLADALTQRATSPRSTPENFADRLAADLADVRAASPTEHRPVRGPSVCEASCSCCVRLVGDGSAGHPQLSLTPCARRAAKLAGALCHMRAMAAAIGGSPAAPIKRSALRTFPPSTSGEPPKPNGGGVALGTPTWEVRSDKPPGPGCARWRRRRSTQGDACRRPPPGRSASPAHCGLWT